MLRHFLILSILIVLAQSVTICSTSSILNTFTDPLCTSWCKVRLCSSGSCRSVQSGSDPTCECESCTFGSWFGGSSSDSNSNQPVTGQYYQAGSGGEMNAQNDYNRNGGYNNGYNNGYNTNGYNNGYGNNNMRSNDGYNSNYRGSVTPGYGNANGNFNSNQQYADQQYYNNGYRGNQYGNQVPSGYGNAGQNNYPSGYQNLK